MRFPLYLRILGCFFLNLLLLAAVCLVFFRLPMQWGLDALMAGSAGEKIESFNKYIASELRDLPPGEWNARLASLGTQAGVALRLYRLNGQPVAGSNVVLPEEIRRKLALLRSPPPLPPPGLDPPRPGERPLRPEKRGRAFEGGPPPDGMGDSPRLLTRAGLPPTYWVLVRSPLPELRPGGPLGLVIESPTLSARGLIFDFQPWLLAGCGVIAISLVVWLPFVSGLTRAIGRLTRATREIADGRFETRVPVSRNDEIGILGQSINRMAERIANQVQGQKRFLGDTAHELVSPLARMEMGLGILEQHALPADRTHLADVREEVRHMSRLVHELLSFSKSTLGAPSLRFIPLLELVEETVQRESIQGVQLEINPALTVVGDPQLLGRALGNILRNAQLYAGGEGPIVIRAIPLDTRIQLGIADSGPGVPDWAIGRLFDPFFRVDDSRDRATGGTGLGLAIAKNAIEACGGTLVARNRKPTGLEMEIVLAAAER